MNPIQESQIKNTNKTDERYPQSEIEFSRWMADPKSNSILNVIKIALLEGNNTLVMTLISKYNNREFEERVLLLAAELNRLDTINLIIGKRRDRERNLLEEFEVEKELRSTRKPVEATTWKDTARAMAVTCGILLTIVIIMPIP